MKDNNIIAKKNVLLIPMEEMEETLQDFTAEEVGAIMLALMGMREPDFEDRAVRIVYRQLRDANERFRASFEAKSELGRKAISARWGKKEQEPSRNTEAIRNDTEAIRNDTEAIRNDTEAIRNDTEAIRNDTEAIRNDTEAIRNDTEAIRNDTTKLNKTKLKEKRESRERKAEPFLSPSPSPSLSEVEAYVKAQGLDMVAENFFDYHEAKGWDGVKDWKAAARRWASKEGVFGSKRNNKASRDPTVATWALPEQKPSADPVADWVRRYQGFIDAYKAGKATKSMIELLKTARRNGMLAKHGLVWEEN